MIEQGIATASRHLDSAARSWAIGNRELAALDLSLAGRVIVETLARMVTA